MAFIISCKCVCCLTIVPSLVVLTDPRVTQQPMGGVTAPSVPAHAPSVGLQQVGQPQQQAVPASASQTPFDKDDAAQALTCPPVVKVPASVEALMEGHLDFLHQQGGKLHCASMQGELLESSCSAHSFHNFVVLVVNTMHAAHHKVTTPYAC